MATSFNMTAAYGNNIRTTNSNAWSFFDVDMNDNNAAYFDDSFTYIEQERPDKFSKSTILLILLFSTILISALIILFVIKRNNNQEYLALNNIANVNESVDTAASYVEGSNASGDVIVKFDNIMQVYTQAIKDPSSFSTLSTVCLNSQLGTTYINTQNNIQTVYDTNDGFIRIYNKLFKTFNYEVDRVIYNEETGTYFCYVKVNVPTELDVQNYILTNKYLISKFFNNNEITSENIINCLDNRVFPSAGIDVTTSILCLEATEDLNGNLVLTTDTPLYNMYNSAYSQMINTTISIIKNGTVVGQ